MRATTVNFERGKDPKEALGVGTIVLKKEFLGYFPTALSTEDFEIYELIEKVILDPTTLISITAQKGDWKDIQIKFPESRFNLLLINSIRKLLLEGKMIYSIRKIDNNTIIYRRYDND